MSGSVSERTHAQCQMFVSLPVGVSTGSTVAHPKFAAAREI